MTSYAQLFATVLPVFLVVLLGIWLRRAGWVKAEAEESLFNLVIKVATPCLIFDSVVGNAALREPGNLLFAPLAGFGLTLASFGIAFAGARATGLHIGTGLRTFAIAAGLANYGYLPLPIVDAMWGSEARGLLLTHNMGVEAAIWTGGVLIISGLGLRDGWRRLLNVPLFSLLAALTVNLAGLGPLIPGAVMSAVHWIGLMLIPLGLVMTGVSIQPHVGEWGSSSRPGCCSARRRCGCWCCRCCSSSWRGSGRSRRS
ncbi:AEC family transporter [Oleiharenicola sp. Vm1]|uniref:AEC family transporter n=1 Tax=Oleiharenicola sp. Vm1 TaxID=3398393 RepID=UPI0039F52ABB